MKVILYGIGNRARSFLWRNGLFVRENILVLVDSDPEKVGTRVQEFIIQSPDIISTTTFDKIIICPEKIDDIKNSLEKTYGIRDEEIISLEDIYQTIIGKLYEKYVEQADARRVIEHQKKKGISVYGCYEKIDKTLYPTNIDDDGDRYITVFNKRMYFPSDYEYVYIDGKEFVNDILYEQGEGSPHLYVKKGEEKLFQNGIIVDGGVCEGNFALRYIDACQKMYLIEADSKWVNMLRKTFKPFKDKVVICDKALGRNDDRDHITLDSLIKEKIDYLKLDIEGAEIDAILGGKNLLERSNCHVAICSYHQQNDRENIEFLLNCLGFKTGTSDGYMLFYHDKYFCDTLDLRRGVVYGWKG